MLNICRTKYTNQGAVTNEKIIHIPDQSRGYLSAHEALEYEGFEEVREHDIVNRSIYTKKNLYYQFIDYDYFNTIIYRIELVECDSLEEIEEYNRLEEEDEQEEILHRLKEEVLGNTLTLDELDRVCRDITESDTSMYDFDRANIIWGKQGSFIYEELYLIEYEIIEDGDDLE